MNEENFPVPARRADARGHRLLPVLGLAAEPVLGASETIVRLRTGRFDVVAYEEKTATHPYIIPFPKPLAICTLLQSAA